MSLKQCPECKATVETSKAYCPDCGTPMDEEEKREGFSEFDSLGRTQNLSKTTQFRLLEQFNISSIFTPPQVNENQPKADQNEVKANDVKAEVKATPVNGHQQAQIKPKQPGSAMPKPENVINLKAVNDPKAGSAPASNKNLYYILGGILLFFVLTFIGISILGILRYYGVI